MRRAGAAARPSPIVLESACRIQRCGSTLLRAPTAIQLETRRRRLVEELALRDASEAPPRRARVRRATRRLLGLAGSAG